MNKDKPTLVVLCGVTGSGKTTLAKRLESEMNFIRISSDKIRHRLFPDKMHHDTDSGLVFKEVAKQVICKLKNNHDTVLDANITGEFEYKFSDISSELDVNYLYVWIKTPTQIIKERLSERENHDFPLNLWGASQEEVLKIAIRTFVPPKNTVLEIDGSCSTDEQLEVLSEHIDSH